MLEQKIKIKNIFINYKKFGEKSPSSRFATKADIPPHSAIAQGRLFKKEGNNVFLILHGWGGSSDSWSKVCEILENYHRQQNVGATIYALDFPFFGKSDELKEIWKVDDYVEMVEEFVEKIIFPIKKSPFIPLYEKGELVVIAHSFGGRVAIKLAAKNPQWLERLFLCDAAGIKHPLTIKQKMASIVANIWKYVNGEDRNKEFNGLAHGKIPPAPPLRKGGTHPLSPCPTLRKGGTHPLSPCLPLENRGTIRKFFYHIIGASDYYNCKNEIMKKTFRNIVNEDLTDCLEKIKIPTVIIWGEKDKYTPLSDGILMKEKIKNSELHIIKNVGHGTHLFAPDAVCEIIINNL